MNKDVFVSHASEDHDLAEDACSALENRGLDVWIAPRDVPPGAEWDEAIIEGVKSCACMVFLASEAAIKSKHTKREIGLADEFGKPIIPVTLDVSDPSEHLRYYLSSIQWVDADPSLTESDFDNIAQAIAHRCELSVDLPTGEPGDSNPMVSDESSTRQGDGETVADDEKSPEKDDVSRESSTDISIPRVYIGFGLALLSSLTWGAGNVVTRWTAAQLPTTSFDIAVLKYLLAGAFLVLAGVVIKQRRQPTADAGLFRPALDRRFLTASFIKGINTYSWILAATLIPAGSVATSENMHVVWTTLILAIVFGRDIPGSWFAGTAIVGTGAALVTGIAVGDLSTQSAGGLVLAIISGLAFASFTIIWTGEGRRPDKLWKRSIEMGTLLLTAGITIYPVHLLVSQFWLGGSFIPLIEIPPLHAAVQAINGLIGIGFTYFFMNEALSMTRNLSRLSSLLLAIGLSFSVPFTMLGEFLFLDVNVTLTQWIGVILFILGFTAVRTGILDRGSETSSTQESREARD